MDCYLILCAGEMRRWRNHGGVAKQLIEVDGVPLVDRTIALLHRHGAENLVVVSATEAMRRDGARMEVVKPDVTGTMADKFLSSRHLWSDSGATHILFGDVWFSDHAIRSLVERPRHTRFLGRLTGGRFTGCPYREIFALSFMPGEHATLDDALQDIRAMGPEKPGIASGWSLYDNLVEGHGRRGGPEVDFLHIDDFTEDFDFPKDYERWSLARANPAVPLEEEKESPWRRRLPRYLRYSALVGVGAVVALWVQHANW